MKIRCGYEIVYDCPLPAPMMLMLSLRPERERDLLTPQILRADPPTPLRTYVDGFGNVCTRVLAPQGRVTFSADYLMHDSGEPDPNVIGLEQHAIDDLPDETLIYLLGSRYCDTDKLANFAWAEFGQIPPGGERVAAILNYAHDRVEFGYQHASPARTAHGAHEDRRGVCRDFAHLGAALCRCMNIPARYVTGYLGDIGVAASPDPMDFSGWFEVYLSGAWRAVDARHNKPRIGRILMGVGRDAADVAIATTFGPATLVGFKVWTDEVAE